MPNFSAVLQTVITRLARKELKSSLDPLRRSSSAARREIAELKRRVIMLQKQIKLATKTTADRRRAATPSTRTRLTAKGLRSLRARLGLSASEFGQLIDAKAQSVYNWEAGKAMPRAAQQDAIVALRGMGKRAAAMRLAVES